MMRSRISSLVLSFASGSQMRPRTISLHSDREMLKVAATSDC